MTSPLTLSLSKGPVIPDGITGRALVAVLVAAAEARGLKLSALLRPLTPNPASWLASVARAQSPRAHTLERVRALFAGAPVPPPQPGHSAAERGLGSNRPRGPSTHFVPHHPEDAPAPVTRDPCPRCATRADLGCRHSRKLERAS